MYILQIHVHVPVLDQQEYDGLENCPNEITATLVEMEQFTMLEV